MGPSIFVDGEAQVATHRGLQASVLQWGRRSSSTESRSLGHHGRRDPARFNGAVIFVDGEEQDTGHDWGQGKHLLQWGRRSSSTESALMLRYSNQGVGELQWGRRSSSTESALHCEGGHGERNASMGPSMFVDGEYPDHI